MESRIRRVLIADDEMEICYLLFGILKTEFSVSVVDNGKDFYKLAMSDMPGFDLLIADVRMPYGTGEDVARLLRQMSVKTPILLISARTDFVVPPGISFLAKPFTIQEFKDKVKSLLASAPA